MFKEIKYIGYYDLPRAKIKREFAVSATAKMDYICNTLSEIGYNVLLVSASHSIEPNFKISKGERVSMGKSSTLILFLTISGYSKLMKYFSRILTLTELFFWLIFNTHKNEAIIVYHQIWLSVPIRLAKKIKGFKLILELEEIYSEVFPMNSFFENWEKKLINTADGYILSNNLLQFRMDSSKPNVVIYGRYTNEPKLSSPPNDGKIHLIYAGLIDLDKAGAFNALESTKYLSNKYVLHIIGYGPAVNELKNRILNIQKTTSCKIVYDGEISTGDEYNKYLQSCHIGLSTPKMKGSYLMSYFPSKILSYLSLGLNVVSCNIECVQKSTIGGFITYYYEDNPKAIADAIQAIKIYSVDKLTEVIINHHIVFKEEILNILAFTNFSKLSDKNEY